MVALRVRLGRAEERRIVALVEARPATRMRARYRILDRRNVAVPALVVSERHGGAGSTGSSVVSGWGNVRIHKAAGLGGSKVFSTLYCKASQRGRQVSLGGFGEAKQHRQLDKLGRSPTSQAKSLHSGPADEGAVEMTTEARVAEG